ncbi:MAG TPA: DUF4126 domain-containing protein [Thermoanaerobaculia bacterium]|nr:DUF4126 domain-containing protein [Thermoanaerobaculia bacterium]
MDSLAALSTAAGLGVGAGINAYATLLVFGILGRIFPHVGSGELARFFSSTPVLITLGVLYSIEFVADKIPAVDHVWDVIHTFIRPLAGGIVALAATNTSIPKPMVILATVIGGGVALASHVTKAAVRAASTATTAGVGNPILSVGEDLFAIGQTSLAVVLPYVACAVALLLAVLLIALLARMRGRRATPDRR